MYNPSRGGVRGGADQFTWDSVKNDKHRENYLGHSLMAPVGRWQKGKDLSWYAKERKDSDASDKLDKSELASIKKAEEEAMLIALGHNIVRKTQGLTKEDMQEALKRNTEKDDHNIERMDGVGSSRQRIAQLSGASKDVRQSNEGVAFESFKERNRIEMDQNDKRSNFLHEEKKKKKSKKHKKEKKHKKHHKESYDSDSSSRSSPKYRTKHKKSGSDSDRKIFKVKSHKKSKTRHKNSDSDDSEEKYHKRHKKQNESVKHRRHDSSESD